MKKIILASASARRREILAHIGLEYTALAADVDEVNALPDTPESIVEELARRKATALSHMCDGDTLIIGSDTIVYKDGRVLTKPTDADDAHRMLKELSGTYHSVYSGLCVTDGKKTICTHVVTGVKMREISEPEICAYIATGEPLDKAGSYGIQDIGGIFVERIEGDYYNVVGLPLEALCTILQNDFDIDLFSLIKK